MQPCFTGLSSLALCITSLFFVLSSTVSASDAFHCCIGASRFTCPLSGTLALLRLRTNRSLPKVPNYTHHWRKCDIGAYFRSFHTRCSPDQLGFPSVYRVESPRVRTKDSMVPIHIARCSSPIVPVNHNLHKPAFLRVHCGGCMPLDFGRRPTSNHGPQV